MWLSTQPTSYWQQGCDYGKEARGILEAVVDPRWHLPGFKEGYHFGRDRAHVSDPRVPAWTLLTVHTHSAIGVDAPPLTDEEIKAIAQQWFTTGENQLRADGYYYRSLGTTTNVRESDLIAFAREVLSRAAIVSDTA